MHGVRVHTPTAAQCACNTADPSSQPRQSGVHPLAVAQCDQRWSHHSVAGTLMHCTSDSSAAAATASSRGSIYPAAEKLQRRCHTAAAAAPPTSLLSRGRLTCDYWRPLRQPAMDIWGHLPAVPLCGICTCFCCRTIPPGSRCLQLGTCCKLAVAVSWAQPSC